VVRISKESEKFRFEILADKNFSVIKKYSQEKIVNFLIVFHKDGIIQYYLQKYEKYVYCRFP